MNLASRAWLYRAITLLGVVAALLALMLVSQHRNEPDDWATYYAVKNFAAGKLTISDAELQAQAAEAESLGAELTHYVSVAPDRWAFAKAPGYIFYLLPFYLIGAPRLATVLLLLGLAGVTYLVLARLRDERAATVGTLLLLFTPMLLVMTQRHYMDSLASLAFPALGGGLYLYYLAHYQSPRSRAGLVVLFLAGLLLACGVAARYTNGLILAVFALHFLLTRFRSWRAAGLEPLTFGLGVLLPLVALGGYHWAVFGSLFAYGYQFDPNTPKFAYDYVGQPRFWQILRDNLAYLWAALLVAYPLLILAVPAFLQLGWEKLAPRLPYFGQGRPDGWPELGRGVLALLGGWVLAAYGLYLMYEWTASPNMVNMPFAVVTRFYLPALWPLALVGALALMRQHRRLILSVTAAAVVLGLLFFAQAANTTIIYEARRPAAPAPSLFVLENGSYEV